MGRGNGLRLTGMLLLIGGAVAGCGGDGLRKLTRDDVTGLPDGTATGTAFSGQYSVTKDQRTGCRCRVGSCSEIPPSMSQTLNLTQTDGKLQFGATT